ncbi:MAG: addiction module protein [Burkholderiaceae bacterium]|nr:addiction module protein [Burkholderiaceae bacterium]
MSTRIEMLEAEAMKLSAEERANLAQRLIASLSEDTELDQAWAAEVERRIAQIEAGKTVLVPAADAIARARAALR